MSKQHLKLVCGTGYLYSEIHVQNIIMKSVVFFTYHFNFSLISVGDNMSWLSSYSLKTQLSFDVGIMG